MKKTFIAFIAATMLLVSCKNNNKSAADADTAAAADVQLAACSIFSENDDMEIVAIPDRVNEMSADLFRGSYKDSLLDSLLPDGSSPSAINVFLIRTSDYYGGTRRNILIDAGLGEEAGGALLAQLKRENIKPEEIDAVCLTHLHGDHIGGLLKNGQPVFPNAEIYLSVDEFNAWSDDGPMAQQNGLWKQVLSCYANQIRLFNDGDKIVDGWITAHLAPGHTPGHTVYYSGLCYFVGDLVHAQDLQLLYPDFCARYDNDPTQATATRKKWLDTITRAEGLYMCGAHCYEPFIYLGNTCDLVL